MENSGEIIGEVAGPDELTRPSLISRLKEPFSRQSAIKSKIRRFERENRLSCFSAGVKSVFYDCDLVTLPPDIGGNETIPEHQQTSIHPKHQQTNCPKASANL
jgi:hypothetical protein